jgi:hypothetical protein
MAHARSEVGSDRDHDGVTTYRLALGGSVDELLTEGLPVLIRGGLLDYDLTVVVR